MQTKKNNNFVQENSETTIRLTSQTVTLLAFLSLNKKCNIVIESNLNLRNKSNKEKSYLQVTLTSKLVQVY